MATYSTEDLISPLNADLRTFQVVGITVDAEGQPEVTFQIIDNDGTGTTFSIFPPRSGITLAACSDETRPCTKVTTSQEVANEVFTLNQGSGLYATVATEQGVGDTREIVLIDPDTGDEHAANVEFGEPVPEATPEPVPFTITSQSWYTNEGGIAIIHVNLTIAGSTDPTTVVITIPEVEFTAPSAFRSPQVSTYVSMNSSQANGLVITFRGTSSALNSELADVAFRALGQPSTALTISQATNSKVPEQTVTAIVPAPTNRRPTTVALANLRAGNNTVNPHHHFFDLDGYKTLVVQRITVEGIIYDLSDGRNKTIIIPNEPFVNVVLFARDIHWGQSNDTAAVWILTMTSTSPSTTTGAQSSSALPTTSLQPTSTTAVVITTQPATTPTPIVINKNSVVVTLEPGAGPIFDLLAANVSHAVGPVQFNVTFHNVSSADGLEWRSSPPSIPFTVVKQGPNLVVAFNPSSQTEINALRNIGLVVPDAQSPYQTSAQVEEVNSGRFADSGVAVPTQKQPPNVDMSSVPSQHILGEQIASLNPSAIFSNPDGGLSQLSMWIQIDGGAQIGVVAGSPFNMPNPSNPGTMDVSATAENRHFARAGGSAQIILIRRATTSSSAPATTTYPPTTPGPTPPAATTTVATTPRPPIIMGQNAVVVTLEPNAGPVYDLLAANISDVEGPIQFNLTLHNVPSAQGLTWRSTPPSIPFTVVKQGPNLVLAFNPTTPAEINALRNMGLVIPNAQSPYQTSAQVEEVDSGRFADSGSVVASSHQPPSVNLSSLPGQKYTDEPPIRFLPNGVVSYPDGLDKLRSMDMAINGGTPVALIKDVEATIPTPSQPENMAVDVTARGRHFSQASAQRLIEYIPRPTPTPTPVTTTPTPAPTPAETPPPVSVTPGPTHYRAGSDTVCAAANIANLDSTQTAKVQIIFPPETACNVNQVTLPNIDGVTVTINKNAAMPCIPQATSGRNLLGKMWDWGKQTFFRAANRCTVIELSTEDPSKVPQIVEAVRKGIPVQVPANCNSNFNTTIAVFSGAETTPVAVKALPPISPNQAPTTLEGVQTAYNLEPQDDGSCHITLSKELFAQDPENDSLVFNLDNSDANSGVSITPNGDSFDVTLPPSDERDYPLTLTISESNVLPEACADPLSLALTVRCQDQAVGTLTFTPPSQAEPPRAVLDTGAIAGIACASVAVAAIVTCCVIFAIRRKRKRQRQRNTARTMTELSAQGIQPELKREGSQPGSPPVSATVTYENPGAPQAVIPPAVSGSPPRQDAVLPPASPQAMQPCSPSEIQTSGHVGGAPVEIGEGASLAVSPEGVVTLAAGRDLFRRPPPITPPEAGQASPPQTLTQGRRVRPPKTPPFEHQDTEASLSSPRGHVPSEAPPLNASKGPRRRPPVLGTSQVGHVSRVGDVALTPNSAAARDRTRQLLRDGLTDSDVRGLFTGEGARLVPTVIGGGRSEVRGLVERRVAGHEGTDHPVLMGGSPSLSASMDTEADGSRASSTQAAARKARLLLRAASGGGSSSAPIGQAHPWGRAIVVADPPPQLTPSSGLTFAEMERQLIQGGAAPHSEQVGPGDLLSPTAVRVGLGGAQSLMSAEQAAPPAEEEQPAATSDPVLRGQA